MRDIQREIKRQIQLDKLSYKQKLDASLASGNSREAWKKGSKNMTFILRKVQAFSSHNCTSAKKCPGPKSLMTLGL